VPDVTEMTNNPQQLQSQLVVEQDAAASWDSLREVSFFLVSMGGELQYVTNPHSDNQLSPNLANTKAFTNNTLSHQWQYQQFFATFILTKSQLHRSIFHSEFSRYAKFHKKP